MKLAMGMGQVTNQWQLNVTRESINLIQYSLNSLMQQTLTIPRDLDEVLVFFAFRSFSIFSLTPTLYALEKNVRLKDCSTTGYKQVRKVFQFDTFYSRSTST